MPLPVFAGRLADLPHEIPVKGPEGVVAAVKRNLRNALVRVGQEVATFVDAETVDVFGKGHPRLLGKQTRKIGIVVVERRGEQLQRAFGIVVIPDIVKNLCKHRLVAFSAALIFGSLVKAVHQPIERAFDVDRAVPAPQSPQSLDQIARRRKQVAHRKILVGEFAERFDVTG